MVRSRYFVVLLILLTSSFAPAQVLKYEVTSVRANTSDPRGTPSRVAFTPGGDFTGTNLPAQVVLNFAYRLPLYRVEGMPDWFTTERFDINAKAPAGLAADADVRAQLLRGLLEDRFKLKARLVTKETPGMVLTLVRGDGRLGSRLRKSEGGCEAADTAALVRAQGREPTGRPTCSLGGSSVGPLCGTGVTMTQLAEGLGNVFQRHVVDKTGLAGQYDFELTFTPDSTGGRGVSFGGRPCGSRPADAPAFSTAMSEQLGLKLESQRVPAEILVFESAQRPSEN